MRVHIHNVYTCGVCVNIYIYMHGGDIIRNCTFPEGESGYFLLLEHVLWILDISS